jgi:arylsulfatase A-like enzyme
MSTSLLDKPWPWLVAALVLVAVFLGSLSEVDEDADPRPLGTVADVEALAERDDLNILFILIDTLRADHLSSYGYEHKTTPGLDYLASAGVRFPRHLSQSTWTKASMASLWSAMLPTRTGVTRFDHVMPAEAVLAAEALKEGGYKTVAIYRNGWVAPTFGFEQGFDIYTRPVAEAPSAEAMAENPAINPQGTDEQVIESAVEFLRIHGDERWFLYLHLMDLHEYIYDVEAAKFGDSYMGSYDNSLLWTDTTIRIFMQYVMEAGYLDNTMVVITSDHGEGFGEHGLEGHARHVYKETTEVPFIIGFPFRLESGVSVDVRSRNIDVIPTILDLVGLEPIPGVDGKSLRPEILASLRGEPVPSDDLVGISHLDQNWGRRGEPAKPSVSVSDGSLRYVRSVDEEYLYDAERDASETTSYSDEDVEDLERLRKLADEYMATEPRYGEAPTRELNEFELNHLRALGYALP